MSVNQKTKDYINAIAQGLDDILNGKGCPKENKKTGFTLFIYDFNSGPKDGQMNYISNAERMDFIVALKEMLAQLEGRRPPTPETKQ